jgi:uncharacterized damage-inducible protein DinB
VAHAFIMAREDVDMAVAGLSEAQIWLAPGGIAPVGFHVAHLSGATDRLLTYARGESMSDAQWAVVERERVIAEVRPPLEELRRAWHDTVAAALAQLAATPEHTLTEPRAVGRAQLPSTVLGLLFHAAEHASRHTGQIVTTAKLIRGLGQVPAAAAG